MERIRLRQQLADKSNFVVCVELTGGPGFDYGPIEKFLRAYQNAGSLAIPEGFDFACVTLPQNPGGVANIQPADVISEMSEKGLLDRLDVIPHVTCKDHNAYGIVSVLVGHRHAGVESVLLMTGDKPIGAKGVFELDSVGLLQRVRSMNNESLVKARPEALDQVHQFFCGAAMRPWTAIAATTSSACASASGFTKLPRRKGTASNGYEPRSIKSGIPIWNIPLRS